MKQLILHSSFFTCLPHFLHHFFHLWHHTFEHSFNAGLERNRT